MSAMKNKRSTVIGIGLLVVGIVAVILLVVLRDSRPHQARSTRKMAQRLEEIVGNINPQTNPYANEERVAYFQNQKPPPNRLQRMMHEARIAQELLYAGRSEEAAEMFYRLKLSAIRNPNLLPPDFLSTIRSLLAISYLRMAEQDNCLARHNIDSCLLPIRGQGVHTVTRGSTAAIKEYTEILEESPNDLNARWLLNIAYMTLGQYPHRVPKQWLIPPEVFESDYDIKRFVDVAPALGLDVVGLSGGSIMEDFDGDGYLDIMASSWGPRDQIRYFRNNADGTFTDRTEEAGLLGIVGGLNIVQGDYNNDGFPDVLVLRGAWMGRDGRQPNSLLRNNGDGTFDDVTEEAGLLTLHPTQTASWGDYNNDGWLDLFIGNESYQADINPCELFRNNGDGTFTDVAGEAGVNVIGYVKAVAFGDYNNDGLQDLYISRLLEPNLLFRNDGPSGGDGAPWGFTDVTEEAGVAEPLTSFPIWFWDYDNDGWQDIFVSGYRASVGDVAADYLGLPHNGESPRLYRNNGDGSFADVTKEARLDKPLYTMGCNYGDLDNDGYLDFYVGTGDPDYRALMPNRMFRNAGGRFFQDVTTSGGFGHLQKGHGVAFGDIDHDGDQDIYAVIGGAYSGDVFQNVLFENPGHGNHWITLKLEGQQTNRVAIGARIRVRVQTPEGERDIYSTVGWGSSFGASSLRQEIGLGDAMAIREIEITWPVSGTVQMFEEVQMDQILLIREGEAAPIRLELRQFDLSPGKV